ncbi:MAG: DUF5678 domain-containing protein [Candidatus Promineifilaceae bacterium]
MTNQVTVTLPDSVYGQLQQLASSSQRSISEVLVETVTNALPTASEKLDQAQMVQEVQAYVAMHAELLRKYAGEYVAIHNGNLVDHDEDLLALLERREKRYPDEVVMIRQVLAEPDPILHFRSPRLIRNGS